MKIVKRRLLWFIELFVWLLILLLISCGIMFAKYNYKKNFNTYQMFLPDVDGLIIGSPVKFMGIQIGYVSQLDIVGEDIYVKFIVTEDNVKIPHGSEATVEFSGLGGSKSLELYPPSSTSKECCKMIVPQPPKRIHDSLGLLNDMLESAVEITYNVSHFMEKMGFIKGETAKDKLAIQRGKEAKKERGKAEKSPPSLPLSLPPSEKSSFDDFLDKCNNWLDKTQKQCDKFNGNLENKKVGVNGKNNGKD